MRSAKAVSKEQEKGKEKVREDRKKEPERNRDSLGPSDLASPEASYRIVSYRISLQPFQFVDRSVAGHASKRTAISF